MTVDKPAKSDYNNYYLPFVEKVETTYLEAELKKNIHEMEGFIAQLSQEKWNYKYAEGKWTVGQVLMHICDTEHMFVHRAFWTQRDMGKGLCGFDQDLMAENSLNSNCTPSRFLELYEAQKNFTIAFAKTLKINDWDKSGEIEGNAFNIKMLYYVIVGHERHHLEVLKARYF